MTLVKPSSKPKNPNFSSGPCAKRPGWSLDVLKIILNDVGHNVCPMKFYNMRIISKDFKNIIDNYKDGFYFYLINYLRIENGTYNEYINNKLRINRPITMKHGFKILKLDDWKITDDYEHEELPYPKYEENNDGFIYVEAGELVEPKIINDYIIEINILEKYYNIMMKYNIIFGTIKNANVKKWILNN